MVIKGLAEFALQVSYCEAVLGLSIIAIPVYHECIKWPVGVRMRCAVNKHH